VTFNFGFIEGAFETVCETFKVWYRGLDAKFGTRTEFRRFSATLAEALPSLEPLITPPDRYLIIETRSNWNAIFSNGLRVNDVYGPVSYLPTVLKTRGLEASCTPDFSKTRRKDAIRIYGASSFALYGSEETDWLNRIRAISAANDAGGWSFSRAVKSSPMKKRARTASIGLQTALPQKC